MAHPTVANKKARELGEQQFVDKALAGGELRWCPQRHRVVISPAAAANTRKAEEEAERERARKGYFPRRDTFRISP